MMKKFCCFFLSLLVFLMPVSADLRTVVVSGQTVMINAQYEGVLISGEFDFSINDQHIHSHPDDSVKQGDLVVSVNGTVVKSCKDLNRIIALASVDKDYLDVVVKRNQKLNHARLYLYYDQQNNTFKTGFYVKDHISGIGTLTYIDPVLGSYGALGHEITEKATGTAADIQMGELLSAEVTSIVPSKINQPGEKISKSTGQIIGNIRINNEFGLFGTISSQISGTELPVAFQHDIHLGSAQFYTCTHDQQIIEINIEITKINHQKTPSVKGIEFTVVDQEILAETGGIIQGMSGSPIVQNGKLIGAVTHMIPSSPKKGYGIFIEWMLMNSDHVSSLKQS